MKYLLIFIFNLSVIVAFANGREAENSVTSFKGVVVDKTTGEALAGVKVIIEGTDFEVYTNFNGEFEFTNISAGSYKVHCSMVSYDEVVINNIDILTSNVTKSLTIKLAPAQSQPVNKQSNYYSLG